MPIKSYLAFPHKGQKEQLIDSIGSISCCEVTPSENHDLIILVLESEDQNHEEKLLEKINNLNSLDHLTLVSGFNDN